LLYHTWPAVLPGLPTKDAYLSIFSRGVYVLMEQDAAAVVAFRRPAGGFVGEVHPGRDAVLPPGEIGIDLTLAELYETVEFVADPEDDNAG
jgi:hypothetical protein